MIAVRKKVEDGEKRKTYLKIDTTENINKTLAKLVNMAMNCDDKFTLDKIRLINELIRTKVTVVKQEQLEDEIQELKDIVYANKIEYEEYKEYDEEED